MIVAVGFFDGVHRGHQAILAGADVAVTFRHHPLSVLAPARAPRLIMSWEERARALEAQGVKVTAMDFDEEIANWSPARFLEEVKGRIEVLAEHSGISASPLSFRCGENWRFGKGGAGDAAFLRRLGYAVEVVGAAIWRGEMISSSRIRAALERGEIEAANEMLGKRFTVRGTRFKGKGIGREIGYPTVNLELSALNLELPLGVYEVAIGGAKAIANYGLAPTMGDAAWPSPVLEVHFLQPPSTSISTSTSLLVEFVRFIRPEKKFASLAELQRQIAADCRID